MKSIILSIGFLTIFLSSCNSQDNASQKVPSIILNTLNAKFPNNTDVDWEKKGDLYEAEFNDSDNTEITVQIHELGNLVTQKQEIAISKLPLTLTSIIKNQYKDYKIDGAKKLEKDGKTYYLLELDGKGKIDQKLIFTPEGKEEKGFSFWD